MLLTIVVFYDPETIIEKVGGSVEVQNDRPASSKPLKEKTSKAERRALQEAQRAAKAAAKGAFVSFVLLLIVSGLFEQMCI
jgi:translation initiation factor eIF-2B subunit delta